MGKGASSHREAGAIRLAVAANYLQLFAILPAVDDV
jgi:hypothetical protein